MINGWYNTIHHPRDEDLTVHRLEGLKGSKDRNAILRCIQKEQYAQFDRAQMSDYADVLTQKVNKCSVIGPSIDFGMS